MIRAPTYCALVCWIVYPSYLKLARWVIETCGHSERVFFTIFVTLMHMTLYFGFNSLFMYWDRNGIFEQYKLDRTPVMGPDEALIRKTQVEAIAGQLFIGPLTLWFMYPAFKYFGAPSALVPLPPFPTLVFYFWICFIVNDFGFYWAHRTVHSKSLYATIHKQHHSYIGSVGFAAEFAHPVEQVFANQLPTIGGALLGGMHFCIFFTWLAARMEETYEAHSGYCFYNTWPHKYLGLTNAEHTAYHDFHHTSNTGNFGGCDYLDHIFGTQDSWLAVGGIEGYIAKKRSGNALNRKGK